MLRVPEFLGPLCMLAAVDAASCGCRQLWMQLVSILAAGLQFWLTRGPFLILPPSRLKFVNCKIGSLMIHDLWSLIVLGPGIQATRE